MHEGEDGVRTTELPHNAKLHDDFYICHQYTGATWTVETLRWHSEKLSEQSERKDCA